MLIQNIIVVSKSFPYQTLLKKRFGVHKHPQKTKQKYTLDYQYYSNIPQQDRFNQILQRKQVKRFNKMFQKTIPQFPRIQTWRHNQVSYKVSQWIPKSHPKATILTYHGLNSHTGHCGQFARAMAQQGYLVIGYDYKNFGGSAGKQRGLINSYLDLLDTSEQFLRYVAEKHRQPLFVSGLSLGGAIAYEMAIRNPTLIKGSLLLNPALEDNPISNKFLKKMVVVLSTFGMTFKTFKSPGRNSFPYIMDEFKEKDKLMYSGRLWTTTIAEVLFLMRVARKKYHEFKTPYLIIQGGTDKVLNPFQAIDLQRMSPSQDKTTVIMRDMWHSLYFDDHIQDSIKICCQWLKNRVK